MPVPFRIWNWEDLPDVWKRLLDPVLGRPLLHAAAESMGYAPKEVYTRVGVECSDPVLARMYLKATLCVCASRSYSLEQRVQRPTLIHTEASTEALCDSGLRLGAVIFQDGRTYGLSLDVPTCVVDSWRHRPTYIATAELLIAPL